MATHSSILAWRIPWTEEPVGYSPWGRKESDMTEQLHSLKPPLYDAFGFLAGASGKRTRLPMQETQVRSLGWEDPLKKGMATRFSVLAWKIPWTEEPGG